MPEPRQGSGRFAGRTALVTGAAGGIGRAVAARLAGEGCGVLLTDADAAALQGVRDDLAAAGCDVAAAHADLADATERSGLIPAMRARWPRIDILVNNAAFLGPRTAFTDSDPADWRRIFEVNVLAAMDLARAAAGAMDETGPGAIVNVCSIQAAMPVPTYAAYAASKGAVGSLTRALAVELSPRGIRVNAVAPGVIATPAAESSLADHAPAGEAQPAPATLFGRTGSPEEAAAAIAFLASDDASFITGTTLTVDGGRHLSRKPDPFQAAFGSEGNGGDDG